MMAGNAIDLTELTPREVIPPPCQVEQSVYVDGVDACLPLPFDPQREEKLMAFVFGGDPLPAPVPLPASFWLLIAALVILTVMRKATE